ncbi:Alpha/Beta hydrolase protein [Coniochaeta sp. 2T2.1]|nr:Alpha/Beta hydrolase protein [Coniochaeta sp. 2T2.1]
MSVRLDAEVATALQAAETAGPSPPAPRPALGDVGAHRDGLGANLKTLYQASYPKTDPSVTQEDYYTTSADGHRVLLRWYSKRSSGNGPGILFIHSGGMIMGNVGDFDNILHYYVSKTGVPSLSVEYRLSPEVRYPKALEDTYAGLVWLHQHALDLCVDASRIAVMGESAGGNLAAAVCIYARNKGGPTISQQLLIYPMLDDRTVKADNTINRLLTWRDVDNETGWDAYLGPDRRGSAAVLATAAPSRLVDAYSLPPLYMEVGEVDLFRDENIAYAARFWQAGISAALHVFPGLPHGYELLAAEAKATQEALGHRLRAISSVRNPR